jgi:hypothetical protein
MMTNDTIVVRRRFFVTGAAFGRVPMSRFWLQVLFWH